MFCDNIFYPLQFKEKKNRKFCVCFPEWNLPNNFYQNILMESVMVI